MSPLLKTVLRFGLIILALLILFQLTNASLFIPSISADFVIGIAAIVLLALGIYLGKGIKKEKIVEVKPISIIDEKRILSLGISPRELEVLQLISEGLSNQEIAERLFVSESTIKTHISNLFVKLDVKRRTQAVIRGKEWRIIP
ncbi:regulatory LuxR family protein [Roseivirga ehrenbergii]|uniref:response regulator transcription factor n=1 Tax=Roseivirga ehrenbergii (strain DSM 102268 / JCM 13514 / KCTC 12282 / NCIMB 14502 / KMM 6017) TaxID=279360 RepID=UPI000A01532E|nr:response regulator transcription factor [Roseivirga ehrenbergii]TCK99575.1 regulatory LuxR family protein [Roseivirga ehrenbergii]